MKRSASKIHFFYIFFYFVSPYHLFFAVEYCSDPGSIENGQMQGSLPFTCISSVKYTCNEGYWLLGADTLRCRIDGQWDHGKPSCIDKSKKKIKV